jgi:hypothetical protein
VLELVLAFAPALGAMARSHEALHDVAGASAQSHFLGAAAHDRQCEAQDACPHSGHGDGDGLHRMAHAIDCCAQVVATLPATLNANGSPPGGSPARADVATPASLSSEPLLEPPIR